MYACAAPPFYPRADLDAGRLPDIIIGVGNECLTWPARSYTNVVRTSKARLCLSTIIGDPNSPNTSSEFAFVLGNSFMREYYVMFDTGGGDQRPRVGFAKSVKEAGG